MNIFTRWISLLALALLICMPLIPLMTAAPTGPTITYISNSTVPLVVPSRADPKGTITVITMDSTQQDYKWKAYVGNVTGKLSLDDANSQSIYDWELSGVTGMIFATRFSGTVSWLNISCLNDEVLTAEQTALGMGVAAIDNINLTFPYQNHTSFLIGTDTIPADSCKSTATYLNDTAQVVNTTASFQEVLLQDDINTRLIYATQLAAAQAGYNTEFYNFQMIVAENESSQVPATYYFYVELQS